MIDIGNRIVSLRNTTNIAFKESRVIFNFNSPAEINNSLISSYSYCDTYDETIKISIFEKALKKNFIIPSICTIDSILSGKHKYRMVNLDNITEINFDIHNTRIRFNMNTFIETNVKYKDIYSNDFVYWTFLSKDDFEKEMRVLKNLVKDN